MTIKVWPNKDPNDIKDYEIDWRPRLKTDDDTLISSVFTTETGDVECGLQTIDGTSKFAKVWLSGGTDGETCEILNRVETAAGRQYDQTVRLKIKAT